MAEGQLPKNRGDLFSRFIDRLLHREGLLVKDTDTQTWRLQPDGELLLKGLADLAWQMQRDSVLFAQENENFGVLTTVPRANALQILPSPALVKIALDATLLEGSDELRFRHQLLQEYFTAKALQNAMERTPAQELWPPERWWERSGWEEAAVLLAGFHAGDCSKIVRWLAEAQPEVAAQCVAESGASVANEAALFEELQHAWLPRLTDVKREPAPEARAAVGRALARLGLDRRKGVGLRADALPDIDWVEIPGGEFVYQGEPRKIETFRMARDECSVPGVSRCQKRLCGRSLVAGPPQPGPYSANPEVERTQPSQRNGELVRSDGLLRLVGSRAPTRRAPAHGMAVGTGSKWARWARISLGERIPSWLRERHRKSRGALVVLHERGRYLSPRRINGRDSRSGWQHLGMVPERISGTGARSGWRYRASCDARGFFEQPSRLCARAAPQPLQSDQP